MRSGEFDLYCAVYDKVFSSRSFEQQVSILSALKSRDGELRVLDFGAGTGTFTKLIARQCDLVVAYDLVDGYASLYAELENVYFTADERYLHGPFNAAFLNFNVINYIRDVGSAFKSFGFTGLAPSCEVTWAIEFLREGEILLGEKTRTREVVLGSGVYAYASSLTRVDASSGYLKEEVSQGRDVRYSSRSDIYFHSEEAILDALSDSAFELLDYRGGHGHGIGRSIIAQTRMKK